MNYRKRIKNNEKIICKIFYLIFVIFNLTIESLAASACDRSRKVFEGVSYGEITDGINNYTQVCMKTDNAHSSSFSLYLLLIFS